MMSYNNRSLGIVLIIGGSIILYFSIGDLIFRLMVGLSALSLINLGLKLRGLPPLQFIIPLFFGRRWF